MEVVAERLELKQSVDSSDVLLAEELILRNSKRLTFSKTLEKKFLEDTPSAFFSHSRFYSALALLLIIISGMWDSYIVPDMVELSTKVRFFIVYPLLFVVFSLSYIRRTQKYQELLTGFVIIFASLSITAVMHLSEGGKEHNMFILYAMIIVFTHILAPIRMSYGALCTGVSLGALILSFLFYPKFEAELVSFYIFSICALAVISILSNYQMDYQRRHDFLQTILMLSEKEKLDQARSDLYRLSVLDTLTGLYNRRFFNDSVAAMWRSAYDCQEHVSFLFIDVDHFKLYNDNYGHQAGDECLKCVAKALQNELNRSTDLVARYGGEEFVIILPSMKKDKAINFAEGVRAAILALEIRHDFSSISSHLTVSIGVSTALPSREIIFDALVESADKALYIAKKSGRNRVEFQPTLTAEYAI